METGSLIDDIDLCVYLIKRTLRSPYTFIQQQKYWSKFEIDIQIENEAEKPNSNQYLKSIRFP